MAAGGGGSWKVAYADFTTAMMALFMVLWLTSQDQKIKEAIERSFKHPYHSFDNKSSGLMPNETIQQVKGSGNFSSVAAVELLMLRKMSEDLLKSMENDPVISAHKEAFELKLTPDGVRLTIFNKAINPVFESDSSDFTDYGEWIVGNLAYTIDRFKNFGLEIEGHTQKFDTGQPQDDSWKLSVDRATVTRSKLIAEGVPSENVTKIGGFGDSKPLENHLATSELNNRVDIWIRIRT